MDAKRPVLPFFPLVFYNVYSNHRRDSNLNGGHKQTSSISLSHTLIYIVTGDWIMNAIFAWSKGRTWLNIQGDLMVGDKVQARIPYNTSWFWFMTQWDRRRLKCFCEYSSTLKRVDCRDETISWSICGKTIS